MYEGTADACGIKNTGGSVNLINNGTIFAVGGLTSGESSGISNGTNQLAISGRGNTIAVGASYGISGNGVTITDGEGILVGGTAAVKNLPNIISSVALVGSSGDPIVSWSAEDSMSVKVGDNAPVLYTNPAVGWNAAIAAADPGTDVTVTLLRDWIAVSGSFGTGDGFKNGAI